MELPCIIFTSQLGYSTGMFQGLWLVVLAVFGAVNQPLAPLYVGPFVGISILNKLVCKFSRMENSFFFIM